MRVHHLNAGTMRPAGTLGGRLAPDTMVDHVLVVERSEGLLLVDTGFGRGDVADPKRLGQPFRALVGPVLEADETVHAQLLSRGLDPADVTDIVLTHLDLDHAGGLADFPQARVHVHEAELAAAQAPTWRERDRYRAVQWAHGPRWVTHATAGETWMGLAAVQALGEDVLLVPLHGHTRGHCGVAVRSDRGWLLHAGDSYFHRSEKHTPPSPPVGIRVYETVLSAENALRKANQDRLREMVAAHGAEVRVFCAHDREELEALAADA
jgi:glyoxylase-like metal-dependent hydrolase (beta-lactamase superfamily II)